MNRDTERLFDAETETERFEINEGLHKVVPRLISERYGLGCSYIFIAAFCNSEITPIE